MLTLSTLVAGCLTVAVLLPPAPAAAQGTFGSLPDKVHRGQKIIVVDELGAVTEGTVEDITDSKLVVNYVRGRIKDPSLQTTRTFTPNDVRQVKKPGHLWDGAIKGAVVGLIPALINIGMDCYDCMEGQFTAFTVMVGAAAGVGIDALSGPKTIFRRDVTASRVSVAPIVGGGRKGIAASLRF